jgi:hypothetical protein
VARKKEEGIIVSKRFTDTDKWKKKWYRELGPRLRDIRQFILDNCDFAGIWEIDLETISHFTGESVSQRDIEMALNGEFLCLGATQIFLPQFIKFQYGELGNESTVHTAVIKRLNAVGLRLDTLGVTLTPTPKDKDKDLGFKERGSGGKQSFDFDALYKIYPRKEGKSAGMKRARETITTQADFDSFATAVRNYSEKCRKEATEPRYIKHWSTFIGSRGVQPWRDYEVLEASETKPTNQPINLFARVVKE